VKNEKWGFAFIILFSVGRERTCLHYSANHFRWMQTWLLFMSRN